VLRVLQFFLHLKHAISLECLTLAVFCDVLFPVLPNTVSSCSFSISFSLSRSYTCTFCQEFKDEMRTNKIPKIVESDIEANNKNIKNSNPQSISFSLFTLSFLSLHVVLLVYL
jgi:hypothetical protein